MAFDVMVPLKAALDELNSDNTVRAIVLTGAGRGFSSGADHRSAGSVPHVDGLTRPTYALRSMEVLDEVILTLRKMHQPIIAAVNGAAASITASFNQAGSAILLTDTSGGTLNLKVENGDANNSADALGIAIDDALDSIDSLSLNRQTLSEATLLSSLNGGKGIKASDIKITDSAGVPDSIDLNKIGSEAKTIGDVIDAINASTKIGVSASINETGNGILLTDTAAGSGTLGVKDINGKLAAELNLTRASETVDINGNDTQIIDGTNSYSVDLSDIEGDTSSISLSSLNDGSGITFGDIRFTDAAGKKLLFDLNGKYAGITTVGQLIDAINTEATSQGVGVEASLNGTETGILITNTAVGSENLKIEDINGTAAADLKILSKDTTTTSVNGLGLFSAQAASQGALETVAARVNELGAGVTASVLNDGIGFRLQLVVDQTGSANEILLEAENSGFSFDEISAARDALLVVGGQGSPGSGVLISSPSNSFDNVISGVELNVQETSETAIDVTVAKTDTDLIKYVENFVKTYNAIRSDLGELTDFNAEDFTTGLLFGTNEALRVDNELSRVVTDRYFGVGSFQSLESIGLSVDADGKLQLDKAQLSEAFADDAQSLQTFFTDENNGIVAKFEGAIEGLAGTDNGLLTNRNNSLQATIDSNLDRIDRFNESLDRQREALLLQFYQLEQVIGGLQASQSALASLQPLAPLVSTRSS